MVAKIIQFNWQWLSFPFVSALQGKTSNNGTAPQALDSLTQCAALLPATCHQILNPVLIDSQRRSARPHVRRGGQGSHGSRSVRFTKMWLPDVTIWREAVRGGGKCGGLRFSQYRTAGHISVAGVGVGEESHRGGNIRICQRETAHSGRSQNPVSGYRVRHVPVIERTELVIAWPATQRRHYDVSSRALLSRAQGIRARRHSDVGVRIDGGVLLALGLPFGWRLQDGFVAFDVARAHLAPTMSDVAENCEADGQDQQEAYRRYERNQPRSSVIRIPYLRNVRIRFIAVRKGIFKVHENFADVQFHK